MRSGRQVLGSPLVRRVAANSGARIAATIGVALATVLVARIGGPAAVGAYALLRMLPGLTGVLFVAGLPGALAYFLAAPRRRDPRVWPTILMLTVVGAALGSVVWLLCSPLLQHFFFRQASLPLVAFAGITIATQLALTMAKTALQGLEDRRGGDAVIAAEELAFLPIYPVAVLLAGRSILALILGLAVTDLAVAVAGWARVRTVVVADTGRPFRPWSSRPSRELAREMAGYGMRGQVGGILTLLNLRLDFAILGAMTGPAVLGTYAVASKYAELLRLPGTALTWVSYPQLAGTGPQAAARRARRLVRPALLGVLVLGVPLFLLTGPVISLLYGASFAGAVAPARVLFGGMLLAGGAGVASGYLYGRGRPGLNSLAMGAGVILTVVLDIALIPSYGATGAAWASTCAYLTSDGLLVLLLLRLTHESSGPRRVADPVEAVPR